MENLARYIIRASFSQERTQYLADEGTVIYAAKGDKKSKSFPVMEWLANLCSNIPSRGEPTVQYHGFGITLGHFSSTGNAHSRYISTTEAL